MKLGMKTISAEEQICRLTSGLQKKWNINKKFKKEKKHLYQVVFMDCSTSAWWRLRVTATQATGLYRTTQLVYFWFGEEHIHSHCIAFLK